MTKANRTALISGGTRGIGKEICYKLAKSGYNIAFCYKDSVEHASQIVEDLTKKGTSCLSVRCDVSKADEVEGLFKSIKSHFGFVDTLVNNAGISHYGMFLDDTEADFDRVIASNTKSVFLLTKKFLPDMQENRFGRVINISSIWGGMGASCEVLYSMSKAAIEGLTRALAREVSSCGVTINAVAPGLIQTDMNNALTQNDITEFLKNVPCNRAGTTTEVAELVDFLASEKSSYITGQVININGGMI